MRQSEFLVMAFFNVGATAGLTAIAGGLCSKSTPPDLTANITLAYLLSISGNCARILVNPNAFRSEKIVISAAVLTYTFALYCDLYDLPGIGVYAKLLTTRSVGLWNALRA